MTACWAASTARAAVLSHPVDPAEGRDAPFAVRAGGTAVPLERVGDENPFYYARFAADGPVTVEVSLPGDRLTVAEVRPDRFVRDLEVREASASWLAQGPGPRMCFLSGRNGPLPPFLVLFEPPEGDPTPPRGDDVLDIADFGAVPGPVPQTVAIQKALDACAARPGGGIVCIPAGRWTTGTLRVRDRTRLYLAGGAVLKASDDPADLPADRPEHGDPGATHSSSRLLIFDRARGSGLFGRGTLDANGAVLRLRHDRRVQVIDVTDSSDIVIEGVVLRNTASWTLHILHSDNVCVRDVKIIADWAVANSDGIDPDASTHVLVERLFCCSGDDAVAVKTTGNSGLLAPCANNAVRDAVIMTRKTALKIGTETLADIRNVLFENIDLVRCARGAAGWARDGGIGANALWRDVRMELVEYPGERLSGQPFYVMARKRHGPGRVRNLRFERIEAAAPWFSLIESDPDRPIDDVVFEDCCLNVRPRTDKTEPRWLFEFDNARGIVFRGLAVDFSAADPAHWKGLWPPAAGVIAEGVEQKPPPRR